MHKKQPLLPRTLTIQQAGATEQAEIYLFAWVVARNPQKIKSWIWIFTARSGTVEKAELAYLLDASTACYFLNCLRDVSKSYDRGTMRFTSSTEYQNLNSSCKVQEEGESTSQISTQEPWKHPRNPTPWAETVFYRWKPPNTTALR